MNSIQETIITHFKNPAPAVFPPLLQFHFDYHEEAVVVKETSQPPKELKQQGEYVLFYALTILQYVQSASSNIESLLTEKEKAMKVNISKPPLDIAATYKQFRNKSEMNSTAIILHHVYVAMHLLYIHVQNVSKAKTEFVSQSFLGLVKAELQDRLLGTKDSNRILLNIIRTKLNLSSPKSSLHSAMQTFYPVKDKMSGGFHLLPFACSRRRGKNSLSRSLLNKSVSRGKSSLSPRW